MSDKTIKPYPFCGGRGEILGGRASNGETLYWVWCGCLACGPTKKTRQAAIKAWNKRYF